MAPGFGVNQATAVDFDAQTVMSKVVCDQQLVGRLALRSIIYFEVVTTVALAVGLVAVNLVKPGVGVALTASADEAKQLVGNQATWSGVLEHTVPASFIENLGVLQKFVTAHGKSYDEGLPMAWTS